MRDILYTVLLNYFEDQETWPLLFLLLCRILSVKHICSGNCWCYFILRTGGCSLPSLNILMYPDRCIYIPNVMKRWRQHKYSITIFIFEIPTWFFKYSHTTLEIFKYTMCSEHRIAFNTVTWKLPMTCNTWIYKWLLQHKKSLNRTK